MVSHPRTTVAVVPKQSLSPGGYSPLSPEDDILVDEDDARVVRSLKPVWSSMYRPDNFCDWLYDDCTRYIPRCDGLLATLPVRNIQQNYPTTVAVEMPKAATVADTGFTSGLTWFGQRYRMNGIELSQGALQLVPADYDLTLQCDATLVQLCNARVDAMISSCLFEQLTNDQKTELLTESLGVLRPGGKVGFLYDLRTENAVIAGYRRADPDRYQYGFLDNDWHKGWRSTEDVCAFYREAGLRVTREVFQERTIHLSNSVWTKLAQKPNIRGRLGRIRTAVTDGLMRLTMLMALSATGATLCRLFPQSHARGMITVATKP